MNLSFISRRLQRSKEYINLIFLRSEGPGINTSVNIFHTNVLLKA